MNGFSKDQLATDWSPRVEELRKPGAIHREMRRICAACGVAYDRPDLSLRLGFRSRPAGGRPWVWNGERFLPCRGTSGWYIYPGEVLDPSDDHFYDSMCAKHLVETAIVVLPYLALPPGWRFLIAPGYEDLWFDKGHLVE